jgi:hypothetical protein
LFQRFRKSRKRFFLLSKGCWDIPLVGVPLYPHVFVYLKAVAATLKVPLTKNKGFVCWLFLFFASAKQRKKGRMDHFFLPGVDSCYKSLE